jgi:galactokinase/mevalonate kinase-like predicted kinase
MKELAMDAREAIELRDLGRLADVLDASWEANKLVHPSTTNDEVEALLEGVSGLYEGAKLLGAGGGGYVLFLSKNPGQAEKLRERLRNRFANGQAGIVEMSLNPVGLEDGAS